MVGYDSFPPGILGILPPIGRITLCSAFFAGNRFFPLPFFFLLCYDEE